MSKIRDEVFTANQGDASSFGAKSDLALPPARRFAILTYMDARGAVRGRFERRAPSRENLLGSGGA